MSVRPVLSPSRGLVRFAVHTVVAGLLGSLLVVAAAVVGVDATPVSATPAPTRLCSGDHVMGVVSGGSSIPIVVWWSSTSDIHIDGTLYEAPGFLNASIFDTPGGSGIFGLGSQPVHLSQHNYFAGHGDLSTDFHKTYGGNIFFDVTITVVGGDASTSPDCSLPRSTTVMLGGYNPSEPYTCDCQRTVAKPVDVQSGNFYHSFTDFKVPGRGPGLGLSRTYNSMESWRDGPFGYGWQSSFGVSLAEDSSTGFVTVRQETGASTVFLPDGAGGYTTTSYTDATLVKHSGGDWTFTRHGTDMLAFDTSGLLTSEEDLNGEATTYTYSSGQLATITDAAGRTLNLTWTGSHVTAVADSSSPARTVTYSYNGSGDLSGFTDAAGGAYALTYDGDHQMLTMRDARQAGVGVPATVTNTYDSTGRVVSQTDRLGRTTTFDATTVPGSTLVTDPKGNETLYTFAQGLLVSETHGYGTAVAATTTFEYDPVSLGVTKVTDPNSHISTSTYDASLNRTSVTDALSRSASATYNSLHQPLTATDAAGVTTTNTYDTAGNPLSTSTPLVGSSPAVAQLTTFHHDDATHPGDVTAVTDPRGNTSTFVYDAAGNTTSSSDPLGNTTTTTYATAGWPLTVVAPLGNAVGATPAAHTTTMTYNARGQLLTTTDALAGVETRTYDANGNLATLEDRDGNVTNYVYDAEDAPIETHRPDASVTKTEYWPDGTVKTQIDGAGNETHYDYDALGRLSSVTDALARATTYVHDPAGNVTAKQDPGGNCASLTPTRCTTYSYDAANEQTAISYSDSATPDVTAIAYDTNGRRTSMVDGTGTSSWAYDSLGRLTSSTNGAGATVGYHWDLGGPLTGIDYPDAAGTVTRGFDDAGRMTSLTDWLANETTFAYDADGNLTDQTNPNGTSTVTAFDDADRIANITHAAGATPFASFDYARDSLGQLTGVTSSGVPADNHTWDYTALNQLKSDSAHSSDYGYDSADNLTQLGDGTLQAFDHGNQLCWTAPAASVGTCAAPPAGATTFTYDDNGNRTAATPPVGAASSYGYDQANRLTDYTGPTATADYTYDGDGLRAAKTVDSTTTEFAWDQSSGMAMLLAETTGAATTDYVYGPAGVPIEKIDDTTVLSYHQDQLGSTRALTDHTGAVVATYTYDAYGQLTASTGTTPGGGGVGDGTSTYLSDMTPTVTPTNGWGPYELDMSNGEDDPGDGDTLSIGGTTYAKGLGVHADSDIDYAIAANCSLTAAIGVDDEVGSSGSVTFEVWDGTTTRLYQSSEFTGDDPATVINVGLTGVTDLRLVVDAGASVGADHADWGDAHITCGPVTATGSGYLSDAEPSVSPTNVWGPYERDMSNGEDDPGDGGTLAIDGTPYAKGLGVHANSEINYSIQPDCTLTADIGIDDEVGANGAATFEVWDGTTTRLYQSAELTGSDTAVPILVDLTGVTDLRLVVDAGAAIANDHADWADAQLTCTTTPTGSAVTNPIQYAGQYTDPESGLQYLRARYYEPSTGQFLTRDPLLSSTRDAYGYAGRSPLATTDPSGLSSTPDGGFGWKGHSVGGPDDCYRSGHIGDYMTGRYAPPVGFAAFAGYSPVQRDSKAGSGLMEDPGGGCSGGYLLGNDAKRAFDDACKSHDYAYDLLRYAETLGTYKNDDRISADTELGHLMEHVCGETGYLGWWNKGRCHLDASWAEQGLKMWSTVEGPPR